MTDIHVSHNPLRWKPLKWWLLATIALLWAMWISQDLSVIRPVYLLWELNV